MLENDDKEYLRGVFAKELKGNVNLIFYEPKDGCETCAHIKELLQDISSLHDNISVDFRTGDGPRITFEGHENISYWGIPSGHEIRVLIDDMIMVSRGGPDDISPAVLDRIKAIDKPVHIMVFVTPTCPYCPMAVRSAHQYAFLNKNITADGYESLEFPEIADKYQVMAVPKIVINEKTSFEGAAPDDVFVSRIEQALS